ncbi:SpoIID/LytB domain-containing protein [Humisphaera borealis]|uniref:SpoIID/LytB domain-containing protein n=1 Tax=Humisphaera borealis TaxID=2807512 RepID=A0A7M2WQL6_9BACT|nr:SpoIID/LytB domain-containing protein [Humisphaera borealis]QOV87699.1 SpoIID/LytB domain-containing protein [Humisphaera borealis]
MNTAVPVTRSAEGWMIGQTPLGVGTLTLQPEPEGTLSVEGRPYRGTLVLVPTGTTAGTTGEFDVVNHLLIDDYLKGVLAAELYPEFHLEAYKAQAIAARTYAIFVSRTSPKSRHWDLHSDVRSQMYGGIKSETPKSIQAASETAGIVVAFGPPGKERIFKAYYSSCCGGATQAASDAFDETPIAPLMPKAVGRRCDISAGKYKAKFDWPAIVVSRDELARRLKLFGKSQHPPLKDIVGVRKVEIVKTNAAGRPVGFAIEDNRGARYILGSEQFRVAVNWDAPDNAKLFSSYVTPVVAGNSVRFEEGHGFGHGVGLCQWCIEALARQGQTHEAIVQDAYPGAVLLKGY